MLPPFRMREPCIDAGVAAAGAFARGRAGFITLLTNRPHVAASIRP